MLTQEIIEQLSQPQQGLCVSIYSPTHNSGAEAVGDPIWLKNALREAAEMLVEQGGDRSMVDGMLAPGYEFLEVLQPNDYGAGTLCAFLSEQHHQIMFSPVQIAAGRTFVSDRFHLKPLLPVLTDNARFYVLAISRHDVRLLVCTRHAQIEQPLPRRDVPQHILESIPDVEPKESLQHHSVGSRGQGRGDHAAMYHGQGKGEKMEAHQIFHFFRDVSTGLVKYLDGESPLIFAGVEWLFDHYREANTYDHLLETPLTGSFERARPEEIREAAWEIVEPHLRRRIEEARESFELARAYGRASDDVKAAAIAARDGRAGVLFGAVDTEYWGRVPDHSDDVELRAEPRAGDYDLIDYAAVNTMRNGGSAYMLPAEEIPGDGRGAAVILRY
jgi:hypothetical protein